MNPAPFTDEELNAYLDGELPAARRPAVEAFLAENLAEARRLEAYRADGAAIARIFAHADKTLVARRRQQSGRLRSVVSWRSAAAIALIIAGAAASFIWLQAPSGRSELAQFGTQAAIAYSDRANSMTVSLAEVSNLISKSLASPVAFRDPGSSGFRLVGSRVVAGASSPQVQLVLRDDGGTTITMYLEAKPKAADTPFESFPTGFAHTTLVWIDDEIACAVSGTLPPDQLEAAARLIYKSLLS